MQQSRLAHSESAPQSIPSTPLLPSAYEHHISQRIRGLNKHFSSLTMSRPSSPDTTTTTTPDTTPTPAPVSTGATTTRAMAATTQICRHGVAGAPPDCEPCTLHRHTKASKRAWTVAKEVYGPLHWRTSAARRDHTRARVAEQSYLDGYFRAQQQQNVSMSNSSTRAGSSSAAATLDVLPDPNSDDNTANYSGRSTRSGGKTVSFAPDVVADSSSGRPYRAFRRRADEYVPGRYAGDLEDTSGHHVPFSVFYADNVAVQMAITFFKKW